MLIVGKEILKPMTPGYIARYNPNRDVKNPVKPRNVTIEQLLASGCHIGHNKSLCHPAYKPFITGRHGTIHIINLDYTIAHLRRACTLIREISFRHGVVLFIGTRKGHKRMLVSAAERMDGYLLYKRWVPGTITNGHNVLNKAGIRDVPTPFRHFANDEVQEKLADTPLYEQMMVKMVWDMSLEEWVESDGPVPIFRDWKGELRNDRKGPRLETQGEKPPVLPKSRLQETSTSGILPEDRPMLINDNNYENDSDFLDNNRLEGMISDALPDDDRFQILKAARKRGDLANWMAWEKFASIVEIVSTKTPKSNSESSVKQLSQKLMQALSLDPITQFIPDHSDNWYTRQLQTENEELDRQHDISNETGDRNPLEIYAMDKFLAKKGYRGNVRGEYVINRVKNLEKDGLQRYQHVKVFRDGSIMLEQSGHILRFDRTGKRATQFSDGSFKMYNQLFDQSGMRYDASYDALVFSDGSSLIFQDVTEVDGTESRKVLVVVGQQAYDVTSTVAGSTAKREVLEKAEDLMESSHTKQRRSGNNTQSSFAKSASFSEDASETSQLEPSQLSTQGLVNLGGNSQTAPDTVPVERLSTIQKVSPHLGGSPEYVQYVPEQRQRQTGRVASKPEELSAIRGSELLELGENVEASGIDEVISNYNSMTERQLSQIDEDEKDDEIHLPDSPFTPTSDKIIHTIRPDLIVILNPRENRLAIREATNNQIPTIGIVDTDTDPRIVSYSIPANDDSLRSVEYIVGVLSRAGEEGLIHRQRYTEQLEFLVERAKEILNESWLDHKVLTERDRFGNPPVMEDGRTVESVSQKYCSFYNLDPKRTRTDTIVKIVAQHIMMGQGELKRLTANTKGWSMQEILDQVKTSTRFPNVPAGVMEEMAQVQMTKTRNAYAEAKHKMDARSERLLDKGREMLSRSENKRLLT